jgi:PAS domain S-box-containing protein
MRRAASGEEKRGRAASRRRAGGPGAGDARRLRDFLTIASDWLWEMGPDLRFTFLTEREAGIEPRPATMIGRTRWEAAGVDDPDADPHWRRHKQDLEARRPFRDFEFWIQISDGRIEWRQVSGQPFHDDAGRFSGYRGVARDITARKMAELALQTRTAQLELAFEVAGIGAWESDANGQVTLSPDLWRLLGYEPRSEPMAPSAWLAFVHPDDRYDVGSRATAQVAARGPTALELRMLHQDGSVRHMFSRGQPRYDGRGAYGGFSGVMMDVTPHLEANARLEAKDHENLIFRAIIDSVPDLIFAKDTEGRFLVANVPTVRDMGLKAAEDLIGRGDADLYPPEQAAVFRAQELLVMETLQSRRDVHRVSRLSGEQRIHSSLKAPLLDEEGRVLGIVGINRDVTELEQARAQAEATGRENALFRQLIESLPEMVYAKDRQSRLLYSNPLLVRELPPELGRRIIGMTDAELFDAEDAAEFRAGEQMVVEEGRTFQTVRETVWPSGREMKQLVLKAPLRDADGQIIGIVASNREIGDLMRAQALAEARSLENAIFRAMIEAMPDFVYAKDMEGRFLAANQPTAESLGRASPAELIGRTDFDFQPPEVARRYREDELAFHAHGGSMLLEQPLTFPDGREGWLWSLKTPLHDAEGRLIGYVGHARDVTEEKRAREEIRRLKGDAEIARDTLRDIIDNIAQAVALFDRDRRLIAWNRQFLKRFGLSIHLLARHPTVGELAARGCLPANGDPLAERAGDRWQRPNGTVLEVFARRTPADHLVVAYTDVTQEAAAEQELSETATRLHAIFDNVVDGIVIIEADGRIDSLNPAAAAIFGATTAPLQGGHIGRLVPLMAVPPASGGLPVADLAGSEREVEGRHADGSPLPLRLGVSEVWLHDRRCYVLVVRDITEQRRIDRLKNEFVSTVSHELRTPLTAIGSSIRLIVGGAAGAVPARVARLLEIADRNCARLVRLVSDILDVERLNVGRLALVRTPLDLVDLAERVLQSHRTLAAGQGVELILHAGTGPVRISGDADRLEQVLGNFLANALEYSPAAGAVELAVEAAGVVARVRVTDHGPGVPAIFQDRLFQQFAQADGSDARDKNGSGLGLYIAKGIIDAHGGRIGHSPGPDGGATFWLELPLLPSELVE